MALLTDNGPKIYAFGRFDASHRIAVVLNNDSVTHSVVVPVWKMALTDGSQVTNMLNGGTYTRQQRHGHGERGRPLRRHFGAARQITTAGAGRAACPGRFCAMRQAAWDGVLLQQ